MLSEYSTNTLKMSMCYGKSFNWLKNETFKYCSKIVFVLLLLILSRYLYNKLDEAFYDKISYIFASTITILILIPNLAEFSFFGMKAKERDFSDQIKKDISNNLSKNYE